jgi:hypothetical protein
MIKKITHLESMWEEARWRLVLDMDSKHRGNIIFYPFNIEPATTRPNPITNLYLKVTGRQFTVIGSIAVFTTSQRSS